jgi:hypothetical protein
MPIEMPANIGRAEDAQKSNGPGFPGPRIELNCCCVLTSSSSRASSPLSLQLFW